MVWNLLANALKFTSAGGRVEVKVDRAGADVRITVSDTGCGISSEFLPFIFDRFRQADSTRTRFHGGLGLGLAIVRHLVELHGGTVQAGSAGIGAGSTCTIRLPLAERSSSRTAEPALFPEQPERVAAALPALDNVRVLLVDDDADGLHLLATALADRRASVETALSTTQALEVLEWYKP
ncbi:MAG: ATP-binding protein, partial [Pyrinomonadaceae bacterium]